MFKELRRKDRELETIETEAILTAGIYGVLSVTDETGYAYGVPLNYIYTGDSIYVHSALVGQKLTAIRNNHKVSFCVVGEAVTLPDAFSTQYKSAIVFGTAVEVNAQEKIEALTALIGKYAPGVEFKEKGENYVASDNHRTVVMKITIEHMTGKARK
ncbi:MAG: transporter [Firmicutes bacterium]|nr:transporter [Bacillota bacterium]